VNQSVQRELAEKGDPDLAQPELALIRSSLDAILQSPPFRTTAQCQTLLRYIVERSAEGQTDLLRERVIGSDVFGRVPGYEPGEDPIVRVRVADVRKRLALYYQTLPHPSLRIEIPVGSYRAKFTASAPSAELATALLPQRPIEEVPALSEAEMLPGRKSLPASGSFRHIPRTLILAVGLCILFGLADEAWVLHQNHLSSAALRQFWEPLLAGNRPVLVSVGTNAVYSFTNEARNLYAQQHNIDPAGPEFYMTWPAGQMIDQKDITRAKNSFVALGDVDAITRLAAYLTTQSKPFEERFPPDVSFAELRESPSILVGGFNNAKTMEFTKDLRFYFKSNKMVADHQNPSQQWKVANSGDANDTYDFAIVSRVLSRNGGSPFVAVAGIGQYGTLAAGQFVTDPNSLQHFARSAPKDWKQKNLQLVLRIRVVNFNPVNTQVVAYNIW
jgi:hypothetical protein